MTDPNSTKRSKQRVKTIAIICGVILLTAIIGAFLLVNHINDLRNDMTNHLEAAIFCIEQGQYIEAQTEASEAFTLAKKLRDDEAADKSERIVDLTINVLHGNELFSIGEYNAALNAYLQALYIAKSIENLDIQLIEKIIDETEMYIVFFDLIEDAEKIAGVSEYEAAILVFEAAKKVAISINFADGVIIVDSGIEEMQRLIIQAKREEAAGLFDQAEQYLNNGQYASARIYFTGALQIFLELNDTLDIIVTQEILDYITQKMEEERLHSPPSDAGNLPDDTGYSQEDAGNQSEALSNFDHNSSIDFDFQSLIDNQNQRPANLIRMGTTEGMNEGWYNGCGWIATYNALILLGNPKHPAEIVRYFEESGGTVFDGVFGTYPNTIESYLRSLGYSVSHTLLPQLTMDIDDAIKSSRVSILAYTHTRAAHYIAIEYNEDLDKFIIYNDSFARTRSATLGFDSITSIGAAIDSVSALINNTRSILFSFSLIVVS